MHYEKFADDSVKCIEDEIPFELPEGWAWARIFSITEDLPYGTAKKSTQTGLVAVLRMGNIQSGEIDYSDLVYSSDIDDIEKYTLVKNDLLFNRTNSAEWVGKTAIYRGNIPAIYAGYLIRVRSFIVSEYLNVVMNSGYAKDYCNSVKTDGVNQSNINAQKLGNFLVPIPSLAEQKRISSSILEFIPRISMIQEEKEHIADLILQTKSKILDLAIRGQLVPQNPDDEPASVLLERIRAEKEELIKKGKIKRDKKESIIFKGEDNSYYEKIGKSVSKIDAEIPFALPEGWEWCKLGSLCSSIQYGLSNSAESSGTHKLLRITDIQNGSVNWDTVPYTTTEDSETYILKSNDIVFARTGATVGKSFLIDQLPYESVYASFLIRIRLLKFISPQYIYNFFNSPCYWEQISNKAVGVGQPNCNGTSLSNLFIPIPPAKVQDEIVSLISKLYEHIDSIEKSLS